MFESAKHLSGDDILRQIPLGKFTSSTNVAALVVFLLSDLSFGITGSCVNIDGGYAL